MKGCEFGGETCLRQEIPNSSSPGLRFGAGERDARGHQPRLGSEIAKRARKSGQGQDGGGAKECVSSTSEIKE